MAALLFPANAHSHDPYRTFKFQVLIDPTHIRKLPGGTKYEAITLEDGLTHDPVFEQWANLVNNIDGDAAMSLVDFRKDIVINVLNLQGAVAIGYQVNRAWVSEYQSLPDFDVGTTNAVGIQSIKLEHEGWDRDEALDTVGAPVFL